ncbi:hypothetical protein [Nocardia brevicatena]|uniref:hypothetical protein n=1 Tax=Nocardia brevicatena TaxID=37327 RepID=UPI00059478FC|nr:hypothetical protein [Nocardia brevicatena]
MPHSNRTPRLALLTAALLVGAIATGCSDNNDNGSEAAPSTSNPLPTLTMSPEAEDDTITPEASRQLCDMIGTEIDNWHDQGPIVARVSFNGTVQNWAARNNGLNDEVIADNSIIDTVTTQTCPDVRNQALGVLDVPDLASALVGFGG